MAVKIGLAVGLFIVICAPPGLKSSQVVPEGLVYTEVKKILVRGVQGVLTCRFYGDPLAVYWRKGLDLDDLSPIVVWLDGEVSGPRFDDGSCDVNDNYSLMINNVSKADVGRIYCTVSNNKGPLMHNYTDISVVDTAITTIPQATLQMRQATYGILQCTVHIKARRVSWKKGSTSDSANESLVVMEYKEGVAERSGAGYDDGSYNITQDYLLVIKELGIHDEGLYVCEVTDDTGISFRNHTFVNVVAYPLEPFPTIRECLNAAPHDLNYCILVAKSRMTLTCQAVKYYPSVKLVFLYGSRVLEPSDTREVDNTDGTKNKTVTITTKGNKDLYTCVASSIPGTNANKSTSVLLQGDEPVKSTLVIILVWCVALIIVSSLAYFIRRKKHHNIEEVKDPTQEDFEALVKDTLMQHYRMICDLKGMTSAIQDEKICKENMTALFNTHQMLTDMREHPISTRVKETIDKENKPAYDWPPNEELETISRHLTQDSIAKICKELQMDYQNDNANDEGKWFESLIKWRTEALHKSLEEKYRQLAPVFESNNLGGLLPTLRGPYIYKAELVDMAFHLLMHDLFPIAKQLGINATKLVSYRPTFHPSHLEIGTIKLLIEPFESLKGEDTFKRSTFCSKITNLHMIVGITGMLEYAMSYGELCSISEAINQSARRCADQATSGMLPEELVNLQDVLQLTNQDIADRFDISRPLTAVALFKIWKEKPRPLIFNYRATLAHELRRNKMPGLADEIIAGKYITEKTSHAFIEDMVRGLNQDQIRSLGELLQLSGEEEQWHTSTPFNEISKQIYDRMVVWTTGITGSWSMTDLELENPEITATAKEHRDLNDKLVEHGFLDLAREIMIIETTTH